MVLTGGTTSFSSKHSGQSLFSMTRMLFSRDRGSSDIVTSKDRLLLIAGDFGMGGVWQIVWSGPGTCRRVFFPEEPDRGVVK